MKYLKKYKIFESSNSDSFGNTLLSYRELAEKAKEELEDILIYLKDEGYRVEINVVMDYYAIIHVKIMDYSNKPIMWNDIKDDIERALEVVKDRFIPSDIYYKEVHPDGRIFNRGIRDTMEWNKFQKYINKSNKKLTYLTIELSQIVENNKEWYKGSYKSPVNII